MKHTIQSEFNVGDICLKKSKFSKNQVRIRKILIAINDKGLTIHYQAEYLSTAATRFIAPESEFEKIKKNE